MATELKQKVKENQKALVARTFDELYQGLKTRIGIDMRVPVPYSHSSLNKVCKQMLIDRFAEEGLHMIFHKQGVLFDLDAQEPKKDQRESSSDESEEDEDEKDA